jgi:hypothetical protein
MTKMKTVGFVLIAMMLIAVAPPSASAYRLVDQDKIKLDLIGWVPVRAIAL